MKFVKSFATWQHLGASGVDSDTLVSRTIRSGETSRLMMTVGRDGLALATTVEILFLVVFVCSAIVCNSVLLFITTFISLFITICVC